MHGESTMREWGAVVSVAVRATPSGRGLSLRLAPSWGTPFGGAERVWATGGSGGHTPRWTRRTPGARLGVEIGYGMDALRGRALATPYASLESGSGRRTVRVGWRLDAGSAKLDVEALHSGIGGRGVLLRVAVAPWAAPGPRR